MKQRQAVTSFYVEALLLIAAFIVIMLVMTQVFGLGRLESLEAKRLTNAVRLAENAAEAVSAADDEDELLALMDEDGNAVYDAGVIRAGYADDMTPAADGTFTVEVTWEAQPDDERLISSRITVSCADEDEPIYTLDTSVFLKEVSS